MTTQLAWGLLVASGIVDVAWALSMKKANGFEQLSWSAVSLVLLAIFVLLLTKALQVLPLGTAYVVWTGLGAVGTVIAGVLLFGEPITTARLLWISVVVAGIIGLKTSSGPA